ncbi:MAG TPA: hypothetical protein VJB69_02640 [Candidatus Paceibacterota bacterium]
MTKTKKATLFLVFALVLSLYAVVNHLENRTGTIPLSLQDSLIPNVNEWLTYRNEKYGFEVKYPVDWEVNVSKQTDLENLYFSFINKGVEIVGLGVFNGTIAIDVLDRIFPRPEVKNLVVNGINMINLSDTTYDIYFEKGDLVYYFMKSMFAQEEDDKIIKTILFTFKFFK